MSGQSVGALLKIPQGGFVLERLPKQPKALLRAWDAADEYLLEYLAAQALPAPGMKVVIVNDSFGALAVPLHSYSPVAISDSYLSQQATRDNLKINGFADSSVQLQDSLAVSDGHIDVLLIKVPKTLALLQYQLQKLRPRLCESSHIIVAGMIKALPASVWGLLERYLGPTSTSLAQKKSRLIFVKWDGGLTVPDNRYPVCYQLEDSPYLISNHANVFSRDSLDIGTRFFLRHLPGSSEPLDIIDLGCGNGVVGLMAGVHNPKASICFIDESFMAVASAEDNFRRAFGNSRNAQFLIADGLTRTAAQSADRVFCNPPFHQQHAIGGHIAATLFQGACRVLRKNGQLWVIGNRHLNYHLPLKKLFGNVAVVASNDKFVILRSLQHK